MGMSVPFCQHGDPVGSNLIGYIAIGCNPVATDHHRIDLAFLHQVTGHVVRD